MNLVDAIRLRAYGTSEGVSKAWDTRGRGRHIVEHDSSKSSSAPPMTEERKQQLIQEFKSQVDRQGYDSSKVDIVPIDGGFQHDDNFGAALSSVDSKTGKIDFTPELMTVEKVPGIVAHELTHLRMHRFLDDSGNKNWLNRNWRKMVKDANPGVSRYSSAVWDAVAHKKAPLVTGFQETIAEMARIKSDKGTLPLPEGSGGPLWQNLYDKVSDEKLK